MKVRPLADDDDRSEFDCGDTALNNYIKTVASQDQRRFCAVTRIAVKEEEDPRKVVGYCTLANATIPLSSIPPTRRLPRYHDVPAALLARLAVDRRHQNQAIGDLLIGDAILCVLTMAREFSGCRFLVIDAYPAAVTWYKRYGFAELTGGVPGTNIKMYLDLIAVKAVALEKLENRARSRDQEQDGSGI